MAVQWICNQHVVTSKNCEVWTQWALVPFGPNLLILFPCIQSKIARYELNVPYCPLECLSWYYCLDLREKIKGWTQWVLLTLGMTLLRWFTWIWGMKPIGISAPWSKYLAIISLRPVKRILGMDQRGFSAP